MKFMKENTATSGRGASEIPCEAYSISNSFRCKFIQLAEFQIRRSNTVRFPLLYIFDGRVPCRVIMNLSLPIFFRHYFQRRRSSLSKYISFLFPSILLYFALLQNISPLAFLILSINDRRGSLADKRHVERKAIPARYLLLRTVDDIVLDKYQNSWKKWRFASKKSCWPVLSNFMVRNYSKRGVNA